jgi:N-acetylglucosaminyl-diphospho-decaprenol L-rhamnosyltransferase
MVGSARMTVPAVDAIVVAYESRSDIGPCIESLRGVRGLGTIVVVDHGSDGTASVASALGALAVSDPSNPGFGAGHNRGMSLTSAPFVLLVNPDARVDPGSIDEGLALMVGRHEVAAVQGVVTDAATGRPERSQGIAISPAHLWGRALRLGVLLQWSPVRSLARRIGGLGDHVDRVPTEPVATEALAATAPLVRRQAFDEVGGFDQRFFLYGEDMDLSRRLRDAGWKLLALPTHWADHRAGSSHRSSWQREVQWWRGTMTYAATWYRPGDWALAVGAAVVRAGTLAVRRPSAAVTAFKLMVVDPARSRRTPA